MTEILMLLNMFLNEDLDYFTFSDLHNLIICYKYTNLLCIC